MSTLEFSGLILILISSIIIGDLGLQDRFGLAASSFHHQYGSLFTGISFINCFGLIIFLAIKFTAMYILWGILLMIFGSLLLRMFVGRRAPYSILYYLLVPLDIIYMILIFTT